MTVKEELSKLLEEGFQRRGLAKFSTSQMFFDMARGK